MTKMIHARIDARNQLSTPGPTPGSSVRRVGSLSFMDAHGNTVRVRLRATPGGEGVIAINCGERMADSVQAGWRDLRSLNYDADPGAFEQASVDVLTRVAPALTQALQYAYDANPCIIHVAGLRPSTPASATPADGVVDQAAVSSELRALIGIGAAMGLIGFGYASENGGRLVRAVCPLQSEAGKASSQGAVDLKHHADNANRPIPGSDDSHPTRVAPMNQWQGFGTIQPKRGVPMRVLAVADVMAYMRARGWDDHIEKLREPMFDVAAPASHGVTGGVTGVPVLVQTDCGKLATRYHAVNVTTRNRHAKLALESFGAAIKACGAELRFPGRAGEVLFYQNPRCLHRREPFAPAYDGADRFYLRIYFDTFSSLSRFETGPSVRVFR